MKKTVVCITVFVMLFCLALCASAATGTSLTKLGINGKDIDLTQDSNIGTGWTLNRNRATGEYTLSLESGTYEQITVTGNLTVYVPTGKTVTVGTNKRSYGIGVTDGSLTFNGTGKLVLVSGGASNDAALYAYNSSVTINNTTVSASGSQYGMLLNNSSLTVNGGSLSATGAMNGIYANATVNVNGGVLSAVCTGTKSETAAAIRLKNTTFSAAGGTVSASGCYGMKLISTDFRVSGASVTMNGTEEAIYVNQNSSVQMYSGTLHCTGGTDGINMEDNSEMLVLGGTVQSRVSSGNYSSYAYAVKAMKSNITVKGGLLDVSGYAGIYLSSGNDEAAEGASLSVTGGHLKANGYMSGIRLSTAVFTVSDGLVECTADSYAGIYLSYSPMTVTDGTVFARGGSYGMYCYSSPVRMQDGTLVVAGTRYGIMSQIGKIELLGGHVTADGGSIGISVTGEYLTAGKTAESTLSMTATGGTLALSGTSGSEITGKSGVILFGKVYNTNASLSYKAIGYKDGVQVYRSDDSCVLKLDGQYIDATSKLEEAEENAIFNDGGSASSYTWMLTEEEGRYILTLNGADLSGLDLAGSLTVKLGAKPSIIRTVSVNSGLLHLTGSGTLYTENGNASYAVSLHNACLWQEDAILELRGGLYAQSSLVIGNGVIQSVIRTSVMQLSGSQAVFSGANLSVTDCASVFDVSDGGVGLYATVMNAKSVSAPAFNAVNSEVVMQQSIVTLTGACDGIIEAKKLYVKDTTLSVTNTNGTGIAAGEGGLYLGGGTVHVSAKAEAILSQADIILDGVGLQATSADDCRAVLLYAAPGSQAVLTVTGHCLFDGNATPVRQSDATGTVSYFADGAGPLSAVQIDNNHKYVTEKTVQSCNQPGVLLEKCGLSDCNCTRCTPLPKSEHEYADFVSNGDATCAKDGTKTAICLYCHISTTLTDVGSSSFVPHTFIYYRSDNNATCTADGTKTSTCKVCGIAKNTVADVGSARGHNYERILLVPANCKNYGTWKYTCTRCADSYTASTEEYGDHVWVADDCMSLRTCSVCGLADGRTLGHSFGVFVSNKDATCTQDGTMSAHCMRDGCTGVVTVTDPGSALGHAPNQDWMTVIPATAYRTGYQVRYCTRCSALLETRTTPVVVVPIEGSNLTVDETLCAVRYPARGLTAAQLTGMLDNSVKVYIADKNGVQLTGDEPVGTGCTVKMKSSTNATVYTVLVRGDVTGDGALTAADARYVLRTAVQLEQPNNAVNDACDIDGNGKVDAADARLMLRCAVGLDTLPEWD